MSYGLQVFNPSGGIEIDTSSRLTRIIATIAFDANKGVQYGAPYLTTIYYSGITTDGTWATSEIGSAGYVQVITGGIEIRKYYEYDTTILSLKLFRI